MKGNYALNYIFKKIFTKILFNEQLLPRSIGMHRFFYVIGAMLLTMTLSRADSFELTSPVLINNKDALEIPEIYTCEGQNIAPPIKWQGIPAGTVTLALICDDHDVPKDRRPSGVYDHLVLYNIPSDATGLPEGFNVNTVPKGTQFGRNSANKNNYTGPCPPDRRHMYRFRLYALDTRLELPDGASKEEVLSALSTHQIGNEARLDAFYDLRKRRKAVGQ